jgi:hypothetical protein
MTFQLLEKVRSLPNPGFESLYQTYVGQATEGLRQGTAEPEQDTKAYTGATAEQQVQML